jgi:FixJ family two-component response regulator
LSIYLVDDDDAVRDALRLAFKAHGLDLIAFESPGQLLDEATHHEPSCLILDLQLPGRSAPAWLRDPEFQKKITMPIIILTGGAGIADVVETMKLGAVDFLVKPADVTTLVDRVRQALQLDSRRMQAEAERQKITELSTQISDREWNVVSLICQGDSSKQIARKLGISINTVANHRARLRQKTGAVNTAELIRLVMLADIQKQRKVA